MRWGRRTPLQPLEGPQGEGQARGTSPWDADGRTVEPPAQRQGQGAAQRASLRSPHRYALWGALRAHGGGCYIQEQPWSLHQHQAQPGPLTEVQGSRARGAAAWYP